jgi:hypothetical protein
MLVKVRKPLAFGILASLLAVATAWAADPPARDSKSGISAAPIERFSADQRGHWAYQSVRRAEPPAVKNPGWARNPIDRFIQAELEGLSLEPAPQADRVALIRRVTFDLTGLPPAPAEVASFIADSGPDAYERLVDRLLASPHFGERWGQHWLDLAHYADSNGFELDAERPDAWRYRDWVVAALNRDEPYDRFLSAQIAGDEFAPGDKESLIASGFCRCGPREVVVGNIIPEVRRQNELSEITATVGSVFLGLTIGCARCHDHKSDAIPTTDYYRLQSFFAASELVDVPIAQKSEKDAYAAAEKAIGTKVAPLKQALASLEAPYREKLKAAKRAMLNPEERQVIDTPEKDRTALQKKLAKGVEASLRITWEEVAEAVHANPVDHETRERLKREIAEIERTMPRPPAGAMALVDEKSKEVDTYVYRRGSYKNLGPKVTPRPLGVILASQGGGKSSPPIVPTGGKTGRRLALARWLASADHPLTARVIANRLWQYHFGKGIVATASDFGVRGEPPSHPELLDWLASELISNGWRLKPLHRLMVTSATYRASSKSTPRLAAEDPENTLFGRGNRRRLDAEGLRDAMLMVSGELYSRMGGPGVLAPLEKEVEDLIFTEAEVVDIWPEDRDPREHARRALYLFKKRNTRYPLLEAFDAPDSQNACPKRETSTHALQALTLLNSDFAAGRAKTLAARICRESTDTDARVRRAYEIVLAREPRPSEIERARQFVSAGPSSWVDFALAMLNCNEFLYIP